MDDPATASEDVQLDHFVDACLFPSQLLTFEMLRRPIEFTQYASDDYIHILRTHGFQMSMSAKGNPGDNAFVESFFKTLKYEEIHLWNYETYEDVIERVPYFIEEVYNRKRLHSSIGYRPPIEFEQLVNLKRADRPILNL